MQLSRSEKQKAVASDPGFSTEAIGASSSMVSRREGRINDEVRMETPRLGTMPHLLSPWETSGEFPKMTCARMKARSSYPVLIHSPV